MQTFKADGEYINNFGLAKVIRINKYLFYNYKKENFVWYEMV